MRTWNLPFGYKLIQTRPAGLQPIAGGGRRSGWPTIAVREPYPFAWQHNQDITADSAIRNPTIFSCITLIAETIGKCQLRLVQQTDPDVWTPTANAAYSPVLRKPNRYQTIQKFYEAWIAAKYAHGNAYILKQRDDSRIVRAMYVLDPARVTVLLAPDGGVYYQIRTDNLANLNDVPADSVTVPASEVIHDPMVPLFHPLCGVTPIYACATAAIQALKIQDSQASFFGNGSAPGGVILVPGKIEQAAADAIAEDWTKKHAGVNVNKIAILSEGMTYVPGTTNAVDSQLVEQLKWTTETICGCFKVPAALVDSSHAAPYGNSEQLVQQFYSQCLQAPMTAIELSLDEGLDLKPPYGTEFNVDDLYWMDTATRTKAASDAISGAVLTPNESRRRYFGVGPITGGDTIYMQQQNYSLAALAARDQTNPLAQPPAPPPPPALPPAGDTFAADFRLALVTKAHAKGWRHAA